MQLMTGVKIGDILAVTNRQGDNTSYGLHELERMQAFRGTIGADELPDKRPVNNHHIDAVINAINLALALVAGVQLRFKGWCDIRSLRTIERIYGSDYEGRTEW